MTRTRRLLLAYLSLGSLKDVAVMFLLYSPFAYLAEVLLGVPAFLFYRFFNWKSFVAYGIGGAMIGLISIVVVSELPRGWTVDPGDFTWGASAGVTSALVFRLILGNQSDNERMVNINGEI